MIHEKGYPAPSFLRGRVYFYIAYIYFITFPFTFFFFFNIKSKGDRISDKDDRIALFFSSNCRDMIPMRYPILNFRSFRSYNAFHRSPVALKLVPAIGIIVFASWGLGPFMRFCRIHLLQVCILFHWSFCSSFCNVTSTASNCYSSHRIHAEERW